MAAITLATRLSYDKIRGDLVNPARGHAGNISEFIDGCERAIRLAVKHNALRESRADAGKRRKIVGGGGIEVHRGSGRIDAARG